MATERQIAANRANAKKSTGPRTQAGRARSSQNARTHGLSAESLALHDASKFQTATEALVGSGASKAQVDAASNFFSAQLKLERIVEWRRAAFEILEGAQESGRQAQMQRLAALDRYERYTYTQLFRALSEIDR